MATHSRLLVWRTPRTEKHGGLQSIGTQRVGHLKQLSMHAQDNQFSSVAQLCLTHGLPCSSVLEIFQARMLECVAISSSRGSSQPRDQTHVS